MNGNNNQNPAQIGLSKIGVAMGCQKWLILKELGWRKPDEHLTHLFFGNHKQTLVQNC